MKTIILLLALCVSMIASAQNDDLNITINFTAIHGHRAKITLVDVDNHNDSIVITNASNSIQKRKIKNSVYQVLLEFTPMFYDANYYGVCWKWCGMLVSAISPTKILLFPTRFEPGAIVLFYQK